MEPYYSTGGGSAGAARSTASSGMAAPPTPDLLGSMGTPLPPGRRSTNAQLMEAVAGLWDVKYSDLTVGDMVGKGSYGKVGLINWIDMGDGGGSGEGKILADSGRVACDSPTSWICR